MFILGSIYLFIVYLLGIFEGRLSPPLPPGFFFQKNEVVGFQDLQGHSSRRSQVGANVI